MVAVGLTPDDDPCYVRAIDFAYELAVAFRKILLLHFRGDLYHLHL